MNATSRQTLGSARDRAPAERRSGFRKLVDRLHARPISVVVGAALAFLAALAAVGRLLPDAWEAEAVLVVPKEADAAGSRDCAAEIRDIALLDAVVRDAGLVAPDALDSVRMPVTLKLQQSITVSTPAEGEVHVTLRRPGAEEAADVVNRVARAWATQCAGRNRLRRGEAEERRRKVEALAEALAAAAKTRDDARSALDDFAGRHADALGRDGRSPAEALRTLDAELAARRGAIERLEAKAKGIEDGATVLRTRLSEVPEFVETKETTTERDPERLMLEREIHLMEKQRSEYLETYTSKHPVVQKLELTLMAKKRELRMQRDRVETSVKSSRNPNPEYAALKSKLADRLVELQMAQSELKVLADRPAELSARIETLRGLVEVDRGLRDRLAKAEAPYAEAKTARDAAERDAKSRETPLYAVPGVNVPATVDGARKVGPHRALYLAAALAAAFLGGWAATSASFGMSRGFASAAELEEITSSRVTVSMTAVAGTDAERRTRLRKTVRLGILMGVVLVALLAALAMWPTGT